MDKNGYFNSKFSIIHKAYYNPLWTGLQAVIPRFILGAVLVQIQCISMENKDTVDKNIPKDSTA
jgi:hypothetical protein